MLSSGLSVEGIGHGLPIHSVGSLPSFLAAPHHQHHPMTFMDPFLKSELRTSVPPVPEFIRPLPKPMGLSTKYNNVLTSPASARTPQRSLIGKYHDPGGVGPVNLSQPKEPSPAPAPAPVPASLPLPHSAASVHTSEPPSSPSYRNMYTSPGLFVPPPPPGISMYPPIQSPFGSLYPSHYIPLQLSREQSLAPSTMEQFPSSQPSANSPATAYSPPAPAPTLPSPSSKSSPHQPQPPPPPQNSKRPLKVAQGANSSGKEGSLKHRILTRPEPRGSKRHHLEVGLPTSMPSPGSSSAVAPVTPTSPFSHGPMSPNFSRGSLIQLANGELRKVEDMQAEDFINSAKNSSELCLDPSTVVRIDESTLSRRGTTILTLSHGNSRTEVELESAVEQPYFVMGHGWASCSPDVTFRKYGLECHRLQVGDVCISLSPRQSERKRKKSPCQSVKSDPGAGPAVTSVAVAPQGPGAGPGPRFLKQKDLASSKENVCKKRRWSAPDQFCDEQGVPVLAHRPPSQDSGMGHHVAHSSRAGK